MPATSHTCWRTGFKAYDTVMKLSCCGHGHSNEVICLALGMDLMQLCSTSDSRLDIANTEAWMSSSSMSCMLLGRAGYSLGYIASCKVVSNELHDLSTYDQFKQIQASFIAKWSLGGCKGIVYLLKRCSQNESRLGQEHGLQTDEQPQLHMY
eukprot:1156387-Pelagomonas_calceolata.AAC.3